MYHLWPTVLKDTTFHSPSICSRLKFTQAYAAQYLKCIKNTKKYVLLADVLTKRKHRLVDRSHLETQPSCLSCVVHKKVCYQIISSVVFCIFQSVDHTKLIPLWWSVLDWQTALVHRFSADSARHALSSSSARRKSGLTDADKVVERLGRVVAKCESDTVGWGVLSAIGIGGKSRSVTVLSCEKYCFRITRLNINLKNRMFFLCYRRFVYRGADVLYIKYHIGCD